VVLFVIDTSQTIAEFYGVWHFAYVELRSGSQLVGYLLNGSHRVENYANPIALARQCSTYSSCSL
jgi:hypothetical protein